jgi:hypothetical protein
MAIIVLILLLAELKATMYLPKVVAASHFPLIVVIRSLTHLLTCRAFTVAVMYVLSMEMRPRFLRPAGSSSHRKVLYGSCTVPTIIPQVRCSLCQRLEQCPSRLELRGR